MAAQADEDRRWARELEATAADYVGQPQARAMARRGYFKAEVSRHRSSGSKPPWSEEPRAAAVTSAPRGSAADVYSQGVADGAAGRPHAPTDHPEYVAGYREGASLRK